MSSSEPLSVKSFSLKAQKKILGSMSSKNVAKLLIDDQSARFLDDLYHLTERFLQGQNKGRAEKLIKYAIKTAIKVVVLLRNEQLSGAELQLCAEFRRKLNLAAVTFISFYEVEFTFDRVYLSGLISSCGDLLKSIVRNHLTTKSVNRIEQVFGFYSSGEFLEWIFADQIRCQELRDLVENLHSLLSDGVL